MAPSVDRRYAPRTLIGKGGMGEVWLARDLRVERDIAIKVLRGDGRDDPALVRRFLREARVQCRLEHPSIIPVHDLGASDGVPFFAMKRLAGTTLADVLGAHRAGDRAARDRWPRRLLLRKLIDVCLAVEYAHSRGVIHRDLKPANVMLGDFGEAYVIDWGLAKLTGEADEPIIDHPELDQPGSGQTVAGALLGTPGYMAPEQMRGEPVDHRVDVFALGCMLHEIVCGEPAIPHDRAFEVTLEAAAHRPSERAPEADVPPELDDACARATAADPDRRHPSARALADELQAYLDGDRDRERRRELADDHGRRARAAWQAGGDLARAEVMREAGRALALDPSHREAQDLVGRLLIEAPDRTPPEARSQIERERQRATQALLRMLIAAYGGFLVLLILVVTFAEILAAWPFVVVGGVLGGLTGFCAMASRRPRPYGAAPQAALLVLHFAALMFGATIVGPLLVMPIILVGAVSATVSDPTFALPRTGALLHALAFLVPLGLELAGVLPRTFSFADGRLVFELWAMRLQPGITVVVIAAAVVLQIFTTTSIVLRQRTLAERAQENLHVQRWHLAQLAGDAAPL